MTDRCENCGRERVGERKHVNSTRCLRTGDGGCVAVADAYRRGLREGVELAKNHRHVAIPYREPWGDCGPKVYGDPVVIWTDVDAELERRLK